jgi:hypothetical protein
LGAKKCEPRNHCTPEEKIVKEHFSRTMRRQADGRYVFQLPIKTNLTKLGDSRPLAIKRIGYLEQKLQRNDTLRADYTSFINE